MTEPRRLAMLDERRVALETCGYCPKLCRTACPVSNTEASEALIPWGKMAITWYAARGDLTPDHETAKLPWACTGCFGCRERCEHQNPVAETLRSARAAYRERGFQPPGAAAAEERRRERAARLADRARGLSAHDSGTALLLGCGYLGGSGHEAEDAVRVARALLGPLTVLTGCCGLLPREAGESARADEERSALLAKAAGKRLVTVDAGCTLELRNAGALSLIEVAAERLDHFEPRLAKDGVFRFHDPCRLSRGLRLTREPRMILTRALGGEPAEFEQHGAGTVCSGAGGLLPFTMRRTARTMARARLAEHERLGGGTIVTGCAASLGWLRAQGAPVVDLVSVMARSLAGG